MRLKRLGTIRLKPGEGRSLLEECDSEERTGMEVTVVIFGGAAGDGMRRAGSACDSATVFAMRSYRACRCWRNLISRSPPKSRRREFDDLVFGESPDCLDTEVLLLQYWYLVAYIHRWSALL